MIILGHNNYKKPIEKVTHFQALKWNKKWLKRDKKVTNIEQIISRLQSYIHIKNSKKNTTFYHKITRKIGQISRQYLSYWSVISEGIITKIHREGLATAQRESAPLNAHPLRSPRGPGKPNGFQDRRNRRAEPVGR